MASRPGCGASAAASETGRPVLPNEHTGGFALTPEPIAVGSAKSQNGEPHESRWIADPCFPRPGHGRRRPGSRRTAVSDEEVGRFARAALAVEQIAADAALDATEKKAAMKNAVEQAGFERQRFNEIARASQADAALQARIQAAAAAQVEPATPTR